MTTCWLCMELKSDATFGRGEGLAGLVDQEVEHDRYGLPYVRGRTLKGLLNEECANILYALGVKQGDEAMQGWKEAAQELFGGAGSTISEGGQMNVGAAQLPKDLRDAVKKMVEEEKGKYQAADILESLTAIRHQTAVDEVSGVPDDGTLRAMRTILRETHFEAQLTFEAMGLVLPLLAACTLALTRAGTGRNRGRGRIRATLWTDENGAPGEDVTKKYYDRFCQEVRT